MALVTGSRPGMLGGLVCVREWHKLKCVVHKCCRRAQLHVQVWVIVIYLLHLLLRSMLPVLKCCDRAPHGIYAYHVTEEGCSMMPKRVHPSQV